MKYCLLALLLGGWLAGCAATTPAPVVSGNAGSNDPWADEMRHSAAALVSTLPKIAPTSSKPGEIIVRSGDTLFAIARKHNTSLRALIDANALTPPYRVNAGQVLRLPSLKVHRVARGETLNGISRSYGVTASELVRLNQIRAPYHVLTGQVLILPGATAAPPKPPMRAEPRLPSNRQRMAAVQASPQPRAVKPRAGYFAWPTRGKILIGFGPRANGLHNDGINIAAKPNAPVTAAANGVVSYAGNELRGYGNLLLIRHQGGWITAYAHNSELLVRRGQHIKQGQTIALAGRTGGLARDQVHFEIRQGRKPVNPMRLLSGG